MSRCYRNPDWLREKYHEEGLSTYEMADLAGVNSPSTILNWMEKHGIERRSPESSNVGTEEAQKTFKNEEWLRDKYWKEGLSMEAVGELAGVSMSTIQHWMEKYDIPRRNGSNTPASLVIRKDGYEQWRQMRHRSSVRVSVHQLLVISEGADPKNVFSDGDYQVHHKNGIPWDNRPGNVELLTAGEHAAEHFKPY